MSKEKKKVKVNAVDLIKKFVKEMPDRALLEEIANFVLTNYIMAIENDWKAYSQGSNAVENLRLQQKAEKALSNFCERLKVVFFEETGKDLLDNLEKKPASIIKTPDKRKVIDLSETEGEVSDD